jgi:hypothetical protein
MGRGLQALEQERLVRLEHRRIEGDGSVPHRITPPAGHVRGSWLPGGGKTS